MFADPDGALPLSLFERYADPEYRPVRRSCRTCAAMPVLCENRRFRTEIQDIIMSESGPVALDAATAR